ncbi:MAG: hypothetical protein L0Y71_13350 [Gemmataceae bacterium]|nr:hypothetical protein [Gemmataceae bacterium]
MIVEFLYADDPFFHEMAGEAGEREVAGNRLTLVLFGNDVIDLERRSS